MNNENFDLVTNDENEEFTVEFGEVINDGGTFDYNELGNKPKINGNTVEGNKTTLELGIPVYRPGENITISDDYVISATGGGGGSEEDNITITKNSQNKIQTVAIIDSNTGSAEKTWIGTKQQYDAIQTKDSNTLYYITDDGAISVSWGDIDGTLSNQTDLSNALNNKVDTSKVKNANSTTAGDVYDVRYINTMIGDIESLLSEV